MLYHLYMYFLVLICALSCPYDPCPGDKASIANCLELVLRAEPMGRGCKHMAPIVAAWRALDEYIMYFSRADPLLSSQWHLWWRIWPKSLLPWLTMDPVDTWECRAGKGTQRDTDSPERGLVGSDGSGDPGVRGPPSQYREHLIVDSSLPGTELKT